jgi:hypothetical protein
MSSTSSVPNAAFLEAQPPAYPQEDAPVSPTSPSSAGSSAASTALNQHRIDELGRCLSRLRYLSRLNDSPSYFWLNTVKLSFEAKEAALSPGKVLHFYSLAETVAVALSVCKQGQKSSSSSSRALCGFLLQAFAEAEYCFSDVRD